MREVRCSSKHGSRGGSEHRQSNGCSGSKCACSRCWAVAEEARATVYSVRKLTRGGGGIHSVRANDGGHDGGAGDCVNSVVSAQRGKHSHGCALCVPHRDIESLCSHGAVGIVGVRELHRHQGGRCRSAGARPGVGVPSDSIRTSFWHTARCESAGAQLVLPAGYTADSEHGPATMPS